MPKIKTVKSASRRFKVTGRGKVVSFQAGRRHLLAGKRAKIQRKKRRQRVLAPWEGKKLRPLMPYR